MDYNLIDNVLVMREDKSQEWQPVPVSRLPEALEWANRHRTGHSVQHSGSLSVMRK